MPAYGTPMPYSAYYSGSGPYYPHPSMAVVSCTFLSLPCLNFALLCFRFNEFSYRAWLMQWAKVKEDKPKIRKGTRVVLKIHLKNHEEEEKGPQVLGIWLLKGLFWCTLVLHWLISILFSFKCGTYLLQFLLVVASFSAAVMIRQKQEMMMQK